MYSHRNSDISNLFIKLFEHTRIIKPLQGDNYKIPFYKEIEINSNEININKSTQINIVKKEEEKKEE
jgi:hypothetical protein